MTGPEHYRAAEGILAETEEHPDPVAHRTARRLDQAQVHATLALAAATALDADSREWAEVVGAKLSGNHRD